MARVFQVSTPLSFDTATTNIIELGHPALIPFLTLRMLVKLQSLVISIAVELTTLRMIQNVNLASPYQQQVSQGRKLDTKLAQMWP